MGFRIKIDRIALLKDKESGLSIRQLAEKYNVGYGSVRRYLSSEYLKKIEPEPTPAAPALARVGSIPLAQVDLPLARIGSQSTPSLARTKTQHVTVKKPAAGLNRTLAQKSKQPQIIRWFGRLKNYSALACLLMGLMAEAYIAIWVVFFR